MKILLATDGSDFSKEAINACQNIVAAPENNSFKIISVAPYPMPLASETVMVSPEYYDQIEEAGRLQAREFIRQAAQQLRGLFQGVSLDLTTEVITGSPARVIIESARAWPADLIVVGSHGYGFWSRALLGSVSGAVVHHAPCSVFVVRMPPESNKLAEEVSGINEKIDS